MTGKIYVACAECICCQNPAINENPCANENCEDRCFACYINPVISCSEYNAPQPPLSLRGGERSDGELYRRQK